MVEFSYNTLVYAGEPLEKGMEKPEEFDRQTKESIGNIISFSSTGP